MNKDEKQAAVKEIGAELEASSAVFAVDYRGISVPQAAELRSKLREADASFTVVKNRLAKRVTADAGAEALDEHLTGPTALAYVKGDAVIAAKAITDFIREHETIAYKGGLMDGKVLDQDGFKAISRLPGLDVLRGQLVGMAAAPLTGIVRSLNGLVQGLATQLGQMAEQGLVGGDAPAEEPAAEEPEAEAEAPAEEAKAEEAEAAAETETSDEPEEPEGEEEAAAEATAESESDAEASDAPAETETETENEEN